uniref:Zinc knuckle CX2CX4HX4C domain-containing protein n=1 Tax=Cannabis sativa TaxID=3483 RepID=A0A803NXI9_CANSA
MCESSLNVSFVFCVCRSSGLLRFLCFVFCDCRSTGFVVISLVSCVCRLVLLRLSTGSDRDRVPRGGDPKAVSLNKLDLWVQIHGLSTGFMTEKIVSTTANYIGTLVESDPQNYNGLWREYLRVSVTVNIDFSLKRRMKLKKTGGEWFYANFKYEFVQTFCFICGIIGHSENFCHKLFDTPEEELVKPYGNFMRAPPRRKNSLLGAQYLRVGTEADEQFGHEQPPVQQPEDMPQMHHSNLPRLDFGENHGSKNGNNIPDVVDEGNISNNGNKVNNGNQTISGNKDGVSKFSANERGKSVVFGDHVPGQHSLFLPGPLMTRGGQGGRGPSLETKRRRQSEGVVGLDYVDMDEDDSADMVDSGLSKNEFEVGPGLQAHRAL